jgi:MbtH protein
MPLLRTEWHPPYFQRTFGQCAAEEKPSMDRDEREDTTIYKVVVNHEEQYSIWPADRENALGWNDAGKSGTKAECLAYIKEVWTDMRPLSLRKKMEEMAKGQN